MSSEEVAEVVTGEAADDNKAIGGETCVGDAATKVESADTPNPKESEQSPAEGETQAGESVQLDAEGESAPAKAEDGVTEEAQEKPVNGKSDAVEVKADAESDAADTKPDAESDAAPAVDAKPEAEGDAVVDGKPDAEGDAAVDAKTGAEGDTAIDGKPDAEGDAAVDAKPEAEGDAAVDAKPDAEGDADVDAKPDTEGDAAVDVKPDAENDAVESKPDAESDAVESKPDAEIDAAVDAKPDAESEAVESKPDKESDVAAPEKETPADDGGVSEEKEEADKGEDAALTGEGGESTTTTETTIIETVEDGEEGKVTVKETITVVKTTKIVESSMSEEIDQILKEMTETSQSIAELDESKEEEKPAGEDETDKPEEVVELIVKEEIVSEEAAPDAETEPTGENEEGESKLTESADKGDADIGGDAVSDEPGAPAEPETAEEQKDAAEEEKDKEETEKAGDEQPSDEIITTEVEKETPTTVVKTTTVTTTVTKKPAKRQLYTAGRRTIPKEEVVQQKPGGGDEVVDEDIETLKNKLKVKSIDLRSYSNQKAHHTDDYDVYNVVLRRGQQFEIKVGFEQPVKLEENELYLVIGLGESPKVTDDTRINIPLGSTVKKWRVTVIGVKEEEMTLRIQSPADAPVGRLNIGIGAILKPSADPLQWKYVNLYEHDEHLYLLFNPWCRDDTVFLDNEEARQEYVLNDGGILYEGSHSNPKPRPWNFGQFDTFVVLASIHLLETGLSICARSSSARVARTMSAMVNSQDDDGVLIGNWSGDYSDGKAPSEWAGSVEILSTYKTSEKPIGYAQCAEFSGVLTSVLRCLGIPTRSVTAYSSAQDTDGSMTVDVHWNQNYQPYAQYNNDTVWIYHVYNECYMARPDLHKGKKFRGWQVVDGTPAERSDGLFQTGPAPVNAIKKGNVTVKYDTEYAFAMANADRVHWMIQESNGKVFDKRIIHREPSSIGRRIITKAIGSDDIENVTSIYKQPEGSKDERRAVSNASSHGTVHKKYFESAKGKDFDMKLKFPGSLKIGDDLNLNIQLRNKTDVQQQVDVYVECYGAYYTGVLQDLCKKDKLDIDVPPGHKAKSKVSPKDKIVSGVVTAVGSLRRTSQPAPEPIGIIDVPLTIYFEDYKSFILDHTSLKFFVVAVRKEPQRHEIALQDEIMFQPPSLKMTVADPSKLKRDEEFTVDISFTNPLPIYLTDVRFGLEGLRFQQAKTIQHGDIGPESDVKVNFNLTPKLAGSKVLVATLHTKELHGVSGAIRLEIQL